MLVLYWGLLFCIEKFGPAFEYMQKARNLFEQKGINNYTYTKRYAGGLAECYYRFGEYEQAIKHYKEAVAIPPYWNEVVYFASVENSIALCYQQLKQYDSAIYYFNKSHASAAVVNDSFYMSLSYGNLGYTYHLQERMHWHCPCCTRIMKAALKQGNVVAPSMRPW